MAIKPILFNTEMVRAILGGRKTQTRRLVKPAQLRVLQSKFRKDHPEIDDKTLILNTCVPPCYPGDILYVRETWSGWDDGYVYKADNTVSTYPTSLVDRWHPSIHMPKDAARIFLRVKGVYVERLQSITEIDAQKEGAEMRLIAREIWSYRAGFKRIWDSTIKPVDLQLFGWKANPLVWVIEFERCEKPEAV